MKCSERERKPQLNLKKQNFQSVKHYSTGHSQDEVNRIFIQPNLKSIEQQNSVSSTLQNSPLTPLNKTEQIKQRYISTFQQNIKQLDIKNHQQTGCQSSPHIKINREQRMALQLLPQLHQFGIDNKLEQKRIQIKYVNTLKKVKETGKKLGCSIKVKSTGIQLQLIKQKESNEKDSFQYTFGKQFDRFFRKKLVKGYNSCRSHRQNLNSQLNNNVSQMKDAVNINDNESNYKTYDVKRIETYLRSKANNKNKFPFYIKRQLQQKFKSLKQQKEQKQNSSARDNQSLVQGRRSEPSIDSQDRVVFNRKLSEEQSQISPTFSKNRQNGWYKLAEYEQDITQFTQICEFYKRIQHEILRYLPNNHLANKINAVISQVQNGSIIKRIYDKCDVDIKYLSPNRIISILKKYKGLLSTMNYIVNIVKLNVSAERKKRFIDKQKIVEKFYNIIQHKKGVVSDKLKNIGNQQLKNSVFQSLSKTKVQCLGLNQSYISFAKAGEQQQFSELNSAKNRTIICQILKYQTLMK